MRLDGQRHQRQERCRQLIDATITALAKHGSGRISVRLIAAEAQTSPGLITHHFGSIDRLVAAACTQLSRDSMDALERILAEAGGEPRMQLMAYVAACLRSMSRSATVGAAWLAIAALAHSMPPVAEAQRDAIDRLRERIRLLMTACVPDRAHHLPASTLIAVIQGLWLEMARETPHVTGDDAQRVTLHWLRSLGLLRDDAPSAAFDAPPRPGFAWAPHHAIL